MLLLAAGAVLAAVLAAPAQAAVTKAGGLRYVTKGYEAGNQVAKTFKATCPDGTHVYGGGFFNNQGFGTADLLHSYPYDSGDRRRKPDDGWKTQLLVRAPPVTGSVHAVCAKPMPEYEKVTLALERGPSSHALEPTCDAGLNVLSGGSQGSRNVPEVESWPAGSVDNRDRWHLTVDNFDGGDSIFTARAVCAERDVSYPSALATAGTLDQEGEDVSCPASTHVVGGGQGNDGQDGDVGVAASRPLNVLSPDNGWQAYIDNHAISHEVDFRVHATCIPPLN